MTAVVDTVLAEAAAVAKDIEASASIGVVSNSGCDLGAHSEKRRLNSNSKPS
jgi:hypothetical protein